MTTTGQIGTARIAVVVDTSTAEATVKGFGRTVSDMSAQAQDAYNKLSPSLKKTSDSLINQANKLRMTREEQILYNAAIKGVPLPVIEELRMKLFGSGQAAQVAAQQYSQSAEAMKRLNTAQVQTGMSAKQMAFAVRGLPAQFTDIAVSLQSGQRPLTVLLQQGGQLKDMFGGIGPAARAMGGYIAGLINPVTLTAVAVTALAYAWNKGGQEQREFNKALILTGNYANVTAMQLSDMSRRVADAAGTTQGAASEALAQLANTGRLTSEQMEFAAKAAEQLRQATGRAVDETISDFMKLRGDPVEALLTLNEKWNFLTQAQIDNVRSLKEQGREQEAVTEAFRLFGNVIDDRVPQILDNLGYVERALKIIREGWSGLIDDVKSIGRDKTLEQQMENLQIRIQGVRKARDEASSEGYRQYFQKQLDELEEDFRSRRSRLAMESVIIIEHDSDIAPPARTIISEEERTTQRLREEWRQRDIGYLSRQEQLEVRINEVRKSGLAIGKTEAEINRQVAAERKKFAEQESKRGSRHTKSESILSQIERQIALNREQLETEESLTASERLRVKILHDLREAGGKVTASQRAFIDSQLEELISTGELVEKHKEELKAKQELMRLNVQLVAAALNRERANMIELVSYGRGSDAIAAMRRRLDIERRYEDGLREIRNRGVAETDASYIEQEARLREFRNNELQVERDFQMKRAALMGDWKLGAFSAYEDFLARGMDVASRTNEVFTNAFNKMSDAFGDFVTTGKASFSDFASSVLSDFARMFSNQASVKFLGAIKGGGGHTGSLLDLFRGAWGFANGGVIQSPSLHQYSNQIHDTPKLFAFARGAGVFGEAGPEAIMPLRRGSDGRLGVVASGATGGTSVTVNVIINNDGTATTQTTTGQQNAITAETGRQVGALVKETLVREMRPGGILNKAGWNK